MNGHPIRAARSLIAFEPVGGRGAATRMALVGPTATRGARSIADSETGRRLLRYHAAAAARPSIESMAALRAALTDVVDRLKAQGLSVERVTTVCDTLLREHAATWSVLPIRGGALPAHADAPMHAQLLHWCGQAYRDDAWW